MAHSHTHIHPAPEGALRKVAIIVAVANFAYFLVEFVVARAIGSVSLFADSADFMEDAAVNLLIVFALGWPLIWRARAGFVMAGIALAPALFALWTAWVKVSTGTPPDAITLTITGAGALIVNVSCAILLAKVQHHGGSLGKAAYLCARNDAFANIAIIAAGLVTATLWNSIWPDVAVGMGIFFMNVGAAKEVLEAARDEHAEASA